MPTDLEQERELLRAERDAEICGIGYLVDGVRVSPERVRVFYRDRAALAAPAAPQVAGSWREEFSRRVCENLAAADNQDVPLEEYPGRILSIMNAMGIGPAQIPEAYETIKGAMRKDDAYAWSWHCNLAMPILDTIHCTHRQANDAAARLMQHLFDVDVTGFQEWKACIDDSAPQEPIDYKAMFQQAVASLAAISEALGIPDDEASTGEPAIIIDYIRELKRERDEWVDAGYVAAAEAEEAIQAAPQEQPSDAKQMVLDWMGENDVVLKDRAFKQLCALLSRYGAAPQEQPSEAFKDLVVTLLNHIEDVVSDEDWERVDVELWNRVSRESSTTAPQAGETK